MTPAWVSEAHAPFDSILDELVFPCLFVDETLAACLACRAWRAAVGPATEQIFAEVRQYLKEPMRCRLTRHGLLETTSRVPAWTGDVTIDAKVRAHVRRVGAGVFSRNY